MEEKKEAKPEQEKKQEKDKEKKQEKAEQEKKDKGSKMDRKAKYVIIIIVIIAASLIISLALKDQITDFVKEKMGTTFRYNNFKFEKFYFGDILMYKTEIYVFKNNQVFKYDLLFRNDPRELDKNINVFLVNARLMKRSYFSLSPETDDCNNTILAAWKAGEFLGALGINNSGAVTDPIALANSSYLEDPERVKTCKDSVNATVIVLRKSSTNNSFISQEYEGKTYQNCIVLNYADCETVEVAERFILNFIEEFNKKE